MLGKGENAGFPAFSPFTIMFSKALCLRVVKNRDCVERSKTIFQNNSNLEEE